MFLFLMLLSTTLFAKKKERDYQNYHCNQLSGISEFRPKKDKYVRIDCELADYSIEVDFGKKHYEALGQSLYYSALTNKKAGIWLIIKNPKQMKHAVRLVRNIRMNKLLITVWVIREINNKSTLTLYYKDGG